MTEPEYVFVPGQGWILMMYESAVLETYDGVKVRMERRKPKTGERFSFNTNKDQTWAWWKRWATNTEYKWRSTYTGHADGENEQWDWVTLVKL